jgi:hypothetical protein
MNLHLYMRNLQARFRWALELQRYLRTRRAREAMRERHARAAREWQAYLGELRAWRQACANGTCSGCGYRPCACQVKPDGEYLQWLLRRLAGIGPGEARQVAEHVLRESRRLRRVAKQRAAAEALRLRLHMAQGT